jgi:hypothetical protein
MAQFSEIRRRLARFRCIQLTLQVGAAAVAEAYFVLHWLMSGAVMSLFIAIGVSVLAFIAFVQTCRQLRPEEDLHGTVRRLNAKKKFYRKRLGIRTRFSRFPFGVFGIKGHRK